MTREIKLLDWVKQQHAGQLIKRTTDPYTNHLTAVAQMASVIPLGYEIGLCHDLFEDTETTAPQLRAALADFGYSDEEASFITACVTELTDVFTKKAYPELSKAIRKEKEAARLIAISPAAQTVKYADLMYNISWALKYDLKHSKKYLQRKRLLLSVMADGDNSLRRQVLDLIDKALIV
jgi:(p)ppGpp synthase/HD superfamily hydrolase